VPAIVIVRGVRGHPPPSDSWVRVTGVYQGGPGGLPRIAAISVVEVPVPNEPYE
jgi:hypothetical protein